MIVRQLILVYQALHTLNFANFVIFIGREYTSAEGDGDLHNLHIHRLDSFEQLGIIPAGYTHKSCGFT